MSDNDIIHRRMVYDLARLGDSEEAERKKLEDAEAAAEDDDDDEWLYYLIYQFLSFRLLVEVLSTFLDEIFILFLNSKQILVKSQESQYLIFKFCRHFLLLNGCHNNILNWLVFGWKSIERLRDCIYHVGNDCHNSNHAFYQDIFFIFFMKIWQNFFRNIIVTIRSFVFTFWAFLFLWLWAATLYHRGRSYDRCFICNFTDNFVRRDGANFMERVTTLISIHFILLIERLTAFLALDIDRKTSDQIVVYFFKIFNLILDDHFISNMKNVWIFRVGQ